MNPEHPLPPPPGKLLVLMYHGIHAGRGDRGNYDPRYSIHPDQFKEQMTQLRERGVASWLPVSDEPLVAPSSGPDGKTSVLVTFDDGDVSNIETALPILQELGLGAVFFITRHFVGQRGMISASDLRELADSGMVIGSHGASHSFLNTLTPLALDHELGTSRDFLEQQIGRKVALLSLPGGRGGQRECQAARAGGYRSILGSRPGDNRSTRAGECIDRISMSRGIGSRSFHQILEWRGPAVHRICLRHQVLQLPKKVLGDRGFDRLRQALVR